MASRWQQRNAILHPGGVSEHFSWTLTWHQGKGSDVKLFLFLSVSVTKCWKPCSPRRVCEGNSKLKAGNFGAVEKQEAAEILWKVLCLKSHLESSSYRWFPQNGKHWGTNSAAGGTFQRYWRDRRPNGNHCVTVKWRKFLLFTRFCVLETGRNFNITEQVNPSLLHSQDQVLLQPSTSRAPGTNPHPICCPAGLDRTAPVGLFQDRVCSSSSASFSEAATLNVKAVIGPYQDHRLY